VLKERPDHLLVYSIAVRPTEQRQGHGRTLLNFADQQPLRSASRKFGFIRICTWRETSPYIAAMDTLKSAAPACEPLLDMARSAAPGGP